jgi:hypothetical protein
MILVSQLMLVELIRFAIFVVENKHFPQRGSAPIRGLIGMV